MIVVIMGVSGSGKTTVGSLLASELGWRFWDADAFHPENNVGKMRSGVALSDEDRLPWLESLRALLEDSTQQGQSAVLACSSLKESYRRILADGLPCVRWVYLRGSFDLINARLRARLGHFMNPELLSSQLATLEEPRDAIVVDASLTPRAIVAAIREAIASKSGRT